jgi:hypothetical protein
MLKQSQYIAILEKILTHLKNSKLEYFKASDHAVSPDQKRFFNQQGLQRNRFFQNVLSELQQLGVSSDDLIISKFNFDQLLISTIDTLKASALEKCLHSDESLLEMYTELEGYTNTNLNLAKHIETLEGAISQNKEWVSNFKVKNKKSI